MRRLWFLNLDAEQELNRPGQYQPSKAVIGLLERFTHHALPLLKDEDLVLWHSGEVLTKQLKPASPDAKLGPFFGSAWCPTPHALRSLERAGATVLVAPSLACLRSVNHRAYCLQFSLGLPGVVYHQDLHSVLTHVRRRPLSWSLGWLCKKGFGFAGRGQRRLRDGALTPDDERWVRDAIRQGGIQVEPLVRLKREWAIHGFIPAGCAQTAPGNKSDVLACGVPVAQSTDDRGRWLCATTTVSLAEAYSLQLYRSFQLVQTSLREAGYFGPFSIDAFEYEGATGDSFCSLSEINARYTMGYALGMNRTRQD